MEKELLINILQISNQLKVLHWQTDQYSEHMAFGATYDSLDDKFDLLIESYSGKYQRPKFGGITEVKISDYSNIKIDAFISDSIEFFADTFMAEKDAELANVRDEIITDLQKLKYLLSLK